MELKKCTRCGGAYLAGGGRCPRCGRLPAQERVWDQESKANIGCMLLFVLFALSLVVLPLFLLLSFFFR